ncbi:hypothetical protein [Ottowia sp. VDI28]|uniref:hypothetical protein n=1 Tax=Ottowia sp. VDI28 TaxID=3133968 RepID=UPI003C2B8FC9
MKEYQLLAYGGALIVFLLFFRDGLVGMLSRISVRPAAPAGSGAAMAQAVERGCPDDGAES